MAFFFGKLSELHFRFLNVNSEEKTSIEKKISFFFGHWAEYFQKYVKKISTGISKLHSKFSKGSVEDTLVFSNWVIFFQKFCDLERKNLKKRLLWRLHFFIFCQWAKIYRFLLMFFQQGVKSALYMSMRFLRERTFFWDSLICFTFNVRILSYILSVFRRVVFGRLLKIAIKVFTRNNWGFFFPKSHVLKPIPDNKWKYEAFW